MILYYAIIALHVIVCIILVLVVLLQSGKGADLAGAFGGGATQTAFGSRGPANFLSKMTTVAAVVFMLTSLGLMMISSPEASDTSILETGQPEVAQPVEEAPSAEPPAHIPTREEINRDLEALEKGGLEVDVTPVEDQEQLPASEPEESN